MNHDQHMADEQERQMLEHFRQHSSGEPSAQLDAHILAAAAAATRTAATPEQPASFSARLHNWLFGGVGRQRWPVALAGLACLGIGVSLTWRTLEQVPDAYDAVPMAPVAARVAPSPALSSAPMAESVAMPDESLRARESQPAPMSQDYSAAKAEKKRSTATSSELSRQQQGSEPLQDQQSQIDSEPALRKQAAPSSSQVEQQLTSELQRLLKLRADGWADEADALLLQLMRNYPEQDINARLQQLEPAN